MRYIDKNHKHSTVKFHDTISPGRLKLPTDCAVDDAGNVYVVDFGNNRIVKFSPD
ncbi:MAG TPA: hypothetical protein ENK84_07495 [Desulfobulbus sp.]|nr:hypothetical protein [Desulfobulbus sp.]